MKFEKLPQDCELTKCIHSILKIKKGVDIKEISIKILSFLGIHAEINDTQTEERSLYDPKKCVGPIGNYCCCIKDVIDRLQQFDSRSRRYIEYYEMLYENNEPLREYEEGCDSCEIFKVVTGFTGPGEMGLKIISFMNLHSYTHIGPHNTLTDDTLFSRFHEIVNNNFNGINITHYRRKNGGLCSIIFLNNNNVVLRICISLYYDYYTDHDCFNFFLTYIIKKFNIPTNSLCEEIRDGFIDLPYLYG